MAITATQRTEIVKVIVGLFDAAPGAVYLNEFTSFAGNPAGLISALVATPAFQAIYPTFLTSEEFGAKFVNSLVGSAAADVDKAWAANWIAGRLNAGESRAVVLADVIAALDEVPHDNPIWGAAATQFDNQVKVAEYYSVDLLGSATDVATLKSVVAGVSATTDVSTPAAIEAAISDSVGGGSDLDTSLSVDQDNLSGTAGDDLFTGFIFDNQNTFQSGDFINGGDGVDSLQVEIGNSQNFAITAKTSSVENVFIRAQASAFDNHDNDINDHSDGDPDVQVDAQDMQGLEQIWSVDSRADLIVEDVRVNSHETTIGMRNTDPGDVDYEVYFDQQHITAADPFSEGASLFLRLLDLDGMETDGQPLKNNPYIGLSFTLDGEVVEIRGDEVVNGASTYADLVDGINAALAAAGLTNLEAVLGNPFSAINSDSGNTFVGTEIQIINNGSGVLGVGSWLTPDGELPADNNVLARQSDVQPETVEPITSVNIVLDNVGRDAKAGDLVVGSMSGSGYSGSIGGIQQFDVQVDRDSWIDNLRSTMNTLEVVNVENIAENNTAGDGDVRIDSLNDVRVFDASAMEGDVTLSAALSGRVVGKYLELGDVQQDPAGDNVAFNYTTGNGDDSISLAIDAANLANNTFTDNVGTTTREDFDLNITTGEGDDAVNLSVESFGNLADADGGDAHWYQNSKLNGNLQINTGAGNDTIAKPGSGDVVINAGADDDTVYADNSGAYSLTGRKATFVFNTADQTSAAARNLQNLQSGANDNGLRVFNGELTVTFKGYEVKVDLRDTNGRVTDLQVNQSIKDAINNDAVLSKLLVAKDGPANTLVVESLIDGAMEAADLSVELAAPTSLTPAEVTTLNSAYGLSGQTSAQLLALMNADIAAFETKGDYATAFATFFGGAEYVGVNSTHTSDNAITGGLGNDVIVLGTGAFSNDAVVYEGFGNGTDTIVNFDTTWVATTVTEGSAALPETVTVTFGDFTGSADPETITFDGVTVTLDGAGGQGLVPAADVAFAFVEQYNASLVVKNWTATWSEGTGTVLLENVADGNVTNLVAGDFVVAGATGTVAIDAVVDGSVAFVPAVAEVFSVDFNGTIVNTAGNFVFDGVTVSYAVGDGPVSLAAAVASGAYANWTAVDNFDGTVTLTAKVAGDVPPADDIDVFNALVADGLAVLAAVDTEGAAQVGTATTLTTLAGAAADVLDFSSYDAQAVFVDGILIAGAAPAAGQEYVTLVESGTNAGVYTATLFTEAGATDTQVGVIGVLDFGATQLFEEGNFII